MDRCSSTIYPQVFLATKHGVEAKNYENLGDAAKLKPLEVELKRLEDMSESIVQDFAFMRKREVRTRMRKSTLILLYHYLLTFSGGDARHERVYQQPRPLLLDILNVLPIGSGDLAGGCRHHAQHHECQTHCLF